MRGLFLVALLAVSVSAQEIQVKKVYDFSGGLVNSVSNALMQDNMAKALQNYDIDPFGNLKRRQGLVYSDTNANIGYVYAIMPYVTKDYRQILFLAANSKENWDAGNLTTEIIRCDAATSTCSTMLDRGYYYPSTDWTVPYNFAHFTLRDTLYFVATNGEMFYYVGDSLVKVRRSDTTQPRTLAINATGSLRGSYEYVVKQFHRDTTLGGIVEHQDCSTLTVRTWSVYPHYGTVLLWELPTDTLDYCGGSWEISGLDGPYDSVFLYRRSSELDSFVLVEKWSTLDNNPVYEDTFSTIPDTTTDTLFGFTLGTPDSICEDSILSFQPMSAVIHGNRVYAIGDPEYPNRLYFSTYDRPTNWPCSSFLNIPISDPDWFVSLLSLEDRLVLFRQNSVLHLQGHNFYQYSIDELIANVGLTAPRSVARIGNTVYFYHSTGVYVLSAYGGVSDQPISFPIQKSLDSFMVNQQRAVGAGIAGDYWLSIDYASANQSTYIFSRMPTPHWKSYDFGLHAVVQFDPDTIAGNFNPNHWLIALVSNFSGADRSIFYNWRRDELSGSFENTDTMDVGYESDTTYYPIIATYQSKQFFEGRERERVYWVDIIGEGTCSTITFTFLDEGIPFDTVVFQPDFTDDKRDRIIVDRIVEDFAVSWTDNGYGQYTIKGYEIGWILWDRGRPAP